MKRISPIIFILFCLIINTFSAQGTIHKFQTITVSQYDLSIKIVPDKHRIEINGTWRLPAIASQRTQIEFYLSQKMENLQVQLVEPQTAGSLILDSHTEEGGDMKWVFNLAHPVAAGQSIMLNFSYDSENKPAPQFNISPEGSFAGSGGELWYPQLSFKEREIGTLRLIIPSDEIALSNGKNVSTTAQKAKGEFTFRVTKPVKFGFAAGKYKEFHRTGKVPFALFLLKPSQNSQKILSGCAKALNFLTNLFGDFPYPEFSLLEVDFRSRVAGTGEFGFILADDAEFEHYNLSYWAHEMGHQWWGDVIRSKPGEFGQMMFSEGITQFGALSAVESAEGSKAAEDFRRYGYRGFRKTQSASGYFKLVSSGIDFPLTLYNPKNQDETLQMHQLANSKGFILMDMLSRRIGREKFAAILKHFIRQKAGQLTSWKEFQQTIETEAGQDIHWFFEQWFERKGAPDYQLEWQQKENVISGIISQPTPYFRATLEIEIKGSNHHLLKTVEAINGQTKFKWAVPFKANSVTLDPHYKVLRWTPEFREQINSPTK